MKMAKNKLTVNYDVKEEKKTMNIKKLFITISFILMILITIYQAWASDMSNSIYKIKDFTIEPIETKEMSNTIYKVEMGIEQFAGIASNSIYKISLGFFNPEGTRDQPIPITIIPGPGPVPDTHAQIDDKPKPLITKKEEIVEKAAIVSEIIEKRRMPYTIILLIISSVLLFLLVYKKKKEKKKKKKKEKLGEEVEKEI